MHIVVCCCCYCYWCWCSTNIESSSLLFFFFFASRSFLFIISFQFKWISFCMNIIILFNWCSFVCMIMPESDWWCSSSSTMQLVIISIRNLDDWTRFQIHRIEIKRFHANSVLVTHFALTGPRIAIDHLNYSKHLFEASIQLSNNIGNCSPKFMPFMDRLLFFFILN